MKTKIPKWIPREGFEKKNPWKIHKTYYDKKPTKRGFTVTYKRSFGETSKPIG